MNQTGRFTYKIIGWILVFVFVFSTLAVAGERMAVSVSVANIRSGPGRDHQLMWKAEKYTPIEVLDQDKTGDWLYFKDYAGDKGWIHKNLIRDMDTVITKTGTCNIRSGPGTNHDLSFQSQKGVPFKVLKRKGQWIQIMHADGDSGWIHQKLVW